MIEICYISSKNRSPYKRTSCFSRFTHGMYQYGCGMTFIIIFFVLLMSFPILTIYYNVINFNFYKSLHQDMCNMSTIIAPTALPYNSSKGWIPCLYDGEESFMSCVKLYTHHSNTSLVKQKYIIDTTYYHLHIPGQHEQCTFISNCANNTKADLTHSLNYATDIYNKYYNNLTKCYHDNNYDNIYLEKGKFYTSTMVYMLLGIIFILSGIYLVFMLKYIGSLLHYICGCRSFLDSFDEIAYMNNIDYLTYDINDAIVNPTIENFYHTQA